MVKYNRKQTNKTEILIRTVLADIQSSMDHCIMTFSGQDKSGSTPWAAALSLYYTSRHGANKLKKLSKVRRAAFKPRHTATFAINRVFLRAMGRLKVEDELRGYLDAKLNVIDELSALDMVAQANDMDFSTAWTPSTAPEGDPLKGATDTTVFSTLIIEYIKSVFACLHPLQDDERKEIISAFREKWA